MNLKKSFGPMLDAIKGQYIPVKDEECRMTWGGAVAVPEKGCTGRYIAFNENDQLVAYPEAMMLPIPVMFLQKTVDQLQKGDVIKQGNSYMRVRFVKDGKIHADSYTGYTRNVLPISDFMLGRATVPVAVNLFGCFGNGMQNPMQALNSPFGQQGNWMNMLFLSQLSGDTEEIEDEFTKMNRHELKLYQQKNGLGVRVVPSMSDDALRNAIRAKLGRNASKSVANDKLIETLALTSMMGGQQPGGMQPLAMLALTGGSEGLSTEELLCIMAMQQQGLQPTVAQQNVPQPEVLQTQPVEETQE